MTGRLPPLRDVIRRYDLGARKRLGQNFLLDLNLTDKIARAAGPLDGMCVIEVGPGPGGLTRSLLDNGARRVIAVEQDRRCLPALEEIAGAWPGHLEIVEGDALGLDLSHYADGDTCIVANLPYNIATALVTRWLTVEPWPPWYRSMTLMFQREVADRLASAAGGKAYGRLSVLAQWRADVSRMFDIDRRAFTPVPKVMSSLVRLTPKPEPGPGCRLRDLERVTAAAFGQRRKMLRSSLKALGTDPVALLDAAGIAQTERAEQVDIAGFCRLAACLEQIERDKD
ncbi:MAG: 16S rRNA (adenine(1518)-N(6)/adenine(1519)-N(6))-dimethyltransferase RsmA [Hyphomicrobiales bacterium]